MAKLSLRFESRILKEIPLSGRTLAVGRTPNNDVPIDNPAVSGRHARIFAENGELYVEDLGSLNGTFVNNQRVTERTVLRRGDAILVGKHELVVEDLADVDVLSVLTDDAAGAALPKLDETMILETKKRRDLQKAAPAPAARVRIPVLIVVSGRTDQPEYPLTNKLTVIGKSDMATVKLKGWFKPKLAAQIHKRDDGFYLSRADRQPNLNGIPVLNPVKLSDGDTIEVAGVRLSFVDRD